MSRNGLGRRKPRLPATNALAIHKRCIPAPFLAPWSLPTPDIVKLRPLLPDKMHRGQARPLVNVAVTQTTLALADLERLFHRNKDANHVASSYHC
jgi:hypothetical protein